MKTYSFIDHRNIESTYFLKREVETPYLKKETPVMPAQFSSPMGTVIKSAEDKYTAYAPYVLPSKETEDKYCRHVGVLSSRDGCNWQKDINELAGPHWFDTNGCELSARTGPEGFCVVDYSQLPYARDKYIALYLTQLSEKTDGLCLVSSSDGIIWNEYPENPIIPGWHDTFNIILFDQKINKYVIFLRPPFYAGPDNANRKIARSESPDLINWSIPQQVLETDEIDADAFEKFSGCGQENIPRGRIRQIYGLIPALKYDIYIGFAWIYDVIPGKNWIEFVYSIDGINWIRDESRSPFLCDAEAPMTYGPFFGCPIDANDEHLLYFSRKYCDHHQSIFTRDDRDGIYLYALKKDRWIGYRAEETEGELLTCLIPGSSINNASLNLTVQDGGYIEVIPCDSYGNIIGHSARINGPLDDTNMPVKFTENSIEEKGIRLRIKVKKGKIFCLYT